MAGSKGERTRADIVECAKTLFYEKGYDGTSFSAIVAASGLYRGNIYHYFKTKDDVLRAVIAQRLDEFRAILARYEQEQSCPRARLQAVLGMIAGNSVDLVRYGCPVGSLNTELGKDRRDMQHAARSLFDLLRAWLAARFVELGRGDESDALAMHLLGRAQGIAVMAQAYQDPALLERELTCLGHWIDRQAADAPPPPPADGIA